MLSLGAQTGISARPQLAFQPVANQHLGAQCLRVPLAFVSRHDVSPHPRLLHCILARPWLNRVVLSVVSPPMAECLTKYLACIEPASRVRVSHALTYLLAPCFPDQCLVRGVLCSSWKGFVRAFLLVPVIVSRVTSCASPGGFARGVPCMASTVQRSCKWCAYPHMTPRKSQSVTRYGLLHAASAPLPPPTIFA